MGTAFAAVRPDDRQRAVDTLTLAFSADPILRWMYPASCDYLAHFPAVMLAFGGAAFDNETVWQLGGHSGVAMWMPPGIEPDGEASAAIFEATLAGDLLADMMAMFGQMEDAHPTYPLWYLPWLGVDPALQGTGVGSGLMRPCLEMVDAQHLPAYLDSTNPRNIPFYERQGFEVVGQSQAGSSPAITSMLRAPR
jgi:ribosomal protein S18 acetylase RimI-like enzyme